MLLKDFSPSISLIDYVQCIRIVDFNFQSAEDAPVKAYPPKPENCLHFFLRDRFSICNLDGDRLTQSLILFSGQQTSLINQCTGKSFLDIQVVFQPTAVFRLLGIPAFELANKFIDAEVLFPKNIKSVHQQLQDALSNSERLAIAEEFVKDLIDTTRKEHGPLDAISNQMLKRSVFSSVTALADHSFLSTKQFKRNFYERVGTNPKEYARIVRFNKVFNLRNRYPDKPWDSVASRFGFSDYQHLSKDYKEFTGMSPYQFHQLEKTAPENILGLAKSLYINRAAEIG